MDREEAQHILELCRPDNLEDRNDPLIAKALAQLEHDDTLRTWFEAQQAIDAEITSAFEDIVPPADLKASILAGMRAHAAQATEASMNSGSNMLSFEPETESAPVTTQQRFWKRAAIGAAAVVAIMLAIKTVPSETQTPLASNGTESTIATAGVPSLISFLSNEIKEFKKSAPFEKQGQQPQELQQYLSDSGMPTPGTLPEYLDGLPSLGCVTFRYNSCAISMICFKQDGTIYHLLTTDKSTCAKTYAEQPATYECEGQSFQTWSGNDKIYILSVAGSKQNLPTAAR